VQILITLALLLVGVVAGASAVVQQVVIAGLRASIGSASWAVLISYIGGTIGTALVVLAMREPMIGLQTMAKTPLLFWFAGLFGVVYIFLAILLIPKLGSATTIAVLIAGQLIASVVFDHFGLFGLPQHPVDIQRVAGAVALLAGVMLIRS